MIYRYHYVIYIALLGLTRVLGQDVLDYESEPIRYSKSTPENAISRLNADLEAGRLKLKYDNNTGYLPAVLEALNVPVSSQVLTFAQTSKQADRIRPKTPRAIYFSDDVFVGYVQGKEHGNHGPVILELAVTDPSLGVVFYSLSQTKTDAPRFSRESNTCLTCHGGPKTRGVPGLQVRSVVPDPEGRPILAAGSFRTDHSSPLHQRWGGWYVTGKHGDQTHLGNYIAPSSKKPKQIENAAGMNVTDLSSWFDTKAYLSPHSDLVALMVLEHQIDAINYMTRARFEHQLLEAGKGSKQRMSEAVELLVQHLLFSGETKLTAPVSGTSEFATEFAKRGPFDKSGRSLRQFDLQSRLFKFPLSYMIYSKAFDTLPSQIKSAVYRRLLEVLTETDPGPAFAHLSPTDKSAIRQIAKETLPGFATLFMGTTEQKEIDPTSDAIKDILAVGPDATGVMKAQKAVDALVTAGPKVLPAILAAIPTDDIVKSNWLRVAFNRIVDDAIREKKPIPTDELLRILNDKKKPGRARRLALEAIEKIQPGTLSKLLESGLDDLEFSADAVAMRMEKAATVEKSSPAAAVKLYREAYDAARDFNQCLALAQRLKALDVVVDPLSRLGVVRDWVVLGPFNDPDEKGYAKPYPPESKFDLNASYDGKAGKITWKKFTSNASDGRIDLLKAVGPHDAAVAYAYAVVKSPKNQEVELRATGDDNLAVWVNGTKVIDHSTYRSHLRIDWHRAKVKLMAGENTILVKVCQCPAPKEKAPGPPAKWEFHLRIVDSEGQGVLLPITIPTPEK